MGFTLTIIAGILFTCKLQQVGLASLALTSTAKAVSKQIPISKFHNLFQKHRPNKPQWQPETGIKLWPVSRPRDPHGPAPADNLDDPTISSLICSTFGSEWMHTGMPNSWKPKQQSNNQWFLVRLQHHDIAIPTSLRQVHTTRASYARLCRI